MEEQSKIYDGKRGGWITFPFITATMAGLSIASQGWVNNLIVYLIVEFNVKSIDAAQIYNAVIGCMNLLPIVGAIIADSFLGCFSVIWISSLISLLGIIILVLTATIDSLRPQSCTNGSSLCSTPSKSQFAILYMAITLGTIGVGGSRFTVGTMGANQFDKPKHQASSFSWFVFTMFLSAIVSGTAIVYIEDDVSWGLGFGLCVAANVIGLVAFLSGKRFYHHVKPKGSPFTGLTRVCVGALLKRNLPLSLKSEDYYHHKRDGLPQKVASAPTKTFNFLNHAAIISEGDIQADGTISNLWKLSSVQQVEDLKTLIKILPLWLSGIFLRTPLVILASLGILQAITMDRHIGPHFKIPPGTMYVFIVISTCITLPILDCFLYPTWQKLISRFPPPLQRVGIGHVLCVISMAVSALVEDKRLRIARSHNLQDQSGAIIPMSVFWLVPQFSLAGIGEAFHLPGNTALFYQEFPKTLKSTSTAMVALFIAISYYVSMGLVGLIRRSTAWLPDNLNHGRVDKVYWIFFVISVVNFGYYLVCAWLYKYQDVGEVEDDDSSDN